jgi:hypothetical protein
MGRVCVCFTGGDCEEELEEIEGMVLLQMKVLVLRGRSCIHNVLFTPFFIEKNRSNKD